MDYMITCRIISMTICKVYGILLLIKVLETLHLKDMSGSYSKVFKIFCENTKKFPIPIKTTPYFKQRIKGRKFPYILIPKI